MAILSDILVVVDKPKHEQIALARALALQEHTGARLHLKAFVYEPAYDQREAYDATQRKVIRRAAMDERRQWLRTTLLEAGGDPRFASQQIVWTKDISAWVTSFLEAHSMDLVLKHAHRSQSLTHTPTDWDLIRDCPAPLLLCVRKRTHKAPRILVALDLHSHDKAHARLNRRALATADAISRDFPGSEIHCVYALNISPVLTDLDMVNPRTAREKIRKKASAVLDDLLAPYDIPKSRVYMPTGKIGHAVNNVAAKLKVDVLVIGTTSRRGVRGFLIGNSAEKVLAKARCDVLAIKP